MNTNLEIDVAKGTQTQWYKLDRPLVYQKTISIPAEIFALRKKIAKLTKQLKEGKISYKRPRQYDTIGNMPIKYENGSDKKVVGIREDLTKTEKEQKIFEVHTEDLRNELVRMGYKVEPVCLKVGVCVR